MAKRGGGSAQSDPKDPNARPADQQAGSEPAAGGASGTQKQPGKQSGDSGGTAGAGGGSKGSSGGSKTEAAQQKQLGAAGTSAASKDVQKQRADKAKSEASGHKNAKKNDKFEDHKGGVGAGQGKSLAAKGAAEAAGLPSIPGKAIGAFLAGKAVALSMKNAALTATRMALTNMMMFALKSAKGLFGMMASGMASMGSAVSAAVGGAVSTATASVAVTATGVAVLGGGALAVNSVNNQMGVAQRDGGLFEEEKCGPGFSVASAEAGQVDLDSDAEAMAEEIYAVLSGMGMPDENIAGVLGNFQGESEMDPTGVETIFDEPFEIGERKQAAWDANWDGMEVAPEYVSTPGYNIDKIGVGLGEWTNDRNTLLMDYADDYDDGEWYDPEVQMGFMFTDDDPGRVDYMFSLLDDSLGTPEEATYDFMVQWETIMDDSIGLRVNAAEEYYALMSGWDADEELADSILEAAGESSGEATSDSVASFQRESEIECGEEHSTEFGVTNLDDVRCEDFEEGKYYDYQRGPQYPILLEDALHEGAHMGMACGIVAFHEHYDGELPQMGENSPFGTRSQNNWGEGIVNLPAGSQGSSHDWGGAIDVAMDHTVDGQPWYHSSEGQEYGTMIAEFYMEYADELNVDYVIWWEKIWVAGRDDEAPWEEWQTYSGMGGWSPDGMGSPPFNGDDNSAHRNHPHISFNPEIPSD